MCRSKAGRIVICIMLALAMMFQAACGESQTESPAELYNDEKKIANQYNSFYIEGAEQTLDGRSLQASYEKLEGMIILWAYEAGREMPVDVTYYLKVTQGRAKLVYIHPDDTVVTLVECSARSGNTTDTEVVLSLKKGLNRIKIVADEGTVVEYRLSVPEGELRII